MSNWWLHHVDPHVRALMDPVTGPFAQCVDGHQPDEPAARRPAGRLFLRPPVEVAANQQPVRPQLRERGTDKFLIGTSRTGRRSVVRAASARRLFNPTCSPVVLLVRLQCRS
ncbi:hypothetical protein DL991_31650 [Amycolatopsis sp. WAC 01375]|nr:hypothetical protein DL991_31650 [Amycolatopsis sp. WAC 01375]